MVIFVLSLTSASAQDKLVETELIIVRVGIFLASYHKGEVLDHFRVSVEFAAVALAPEIDARGIEAIVIHRVKSYIVIRLKRLYLDRSLFTADDKLTAAKASDLASRRLCKGNAVFISERYHAAIKRADTAKSRRSIKRNDLAGLALDTVYKVDKVASEEERHSSGQA